MAKNKNTNFRLGMGRADLIEAASFYGKTKTSAKKASTKALEQFIVNKVAGKRTDVPIFNDRQLADLRQSNKRYGRLDTLKLITYHMDKIAGARDEQNFLRLTVARNLEALYDGKIENKHIDELINRLPSLWHTQVDSDFIEIRGSYYNLFTNYIDETFYS